MDRQSAKGAEQSEQTATSTIAKEPIEAATKTTTPETPPLEGGSSANVSQSTTPVANPSMDASTKAEPQDTKTALPVQVENWVPATAPGWPTAEEFLDKHDRGVMTEYSEDVDNILVLDGLFSGIVTAFILAANGLLQADITQTSAELLFRITSQLEGLAVGVAPDPSSHTFRPTMSARWINSLWFVSLLLGLGSALLGILAKQWIREYLNWNSSIASSRQNVLVRQIRFEAWEEWHTHALIAAIPALLEFAIILFVCGLVVFVWTLDLVVAVVVAASIFLFLLLFVVLTLLPSFYKCCPYRTPTSWILIVAWRLTKRAVLGAIAITTFLYRERSRVFGHLSTLCGILPSHTRNSAITPDSDTKSVSDEASDYTWRDRDFEGKNIDRLIDPLGQTEKAPIALCMEHDIQIDLLLNLPHHDPLPRILSSTTATISEPDILFRALSWISAKSGDAQIFRQFAQCAESIHTAKLSDDDLSALMRRLPPSELLHKRDAVRIALLAGFRSLSLWYLLTRMHGGEKAASQSFVELFFASVREAETPQFDSVATRIIHNIRRFYGLDGNKFSDDKLLPITLDFAPKKPLELFSTTPTMSHLRVSGFVLVSDVKMAVLEMLSEDIIDLAMPPQSPEKIRLLRFLHRSVAETITTFHCVLLTDKYIGVSAWESFVVDCFVVLVETYNIIALHPSREVFDSVFPGLRSSLVDLMSRYASLDFEAGGRMKLIRAFYSASNAEGLTPLWARAAIHYPLSFRSTVMEDFHIFDRLASLALADTQWTYMLSSEETDKFCGQLVFVLEYTIGNQWRNGGSFRRLDWLASFAANGGALALYLWMKTPATTVLIDILYPFLMHHHLFNDIYLDSFEHLRIDSYRGLRPDLLVDLQVDPYEDIRIYLYKILFEIFVPPAKRIMLRMEGDVNKDVVYRRSLTHLLLNFPLDQAEAQRWFNLFVWAANEWLLDTLSADEGGWSLARAPEVLVKLREALDFAAARGWRNGGSDKEHFHWASSILTCMTSAPAQTSADQNEGPDPMGDHGSDHAVAGCYRLLRRKRRRTQLPSVDNDAGITTETADEKFEHSQSDHRAEASDTARGHREAPAERIRSVVELLEDRALSELRDLATAMQKHLNDRDPAVSDRTKRSIADLTSYLAEPSNAKPGFLRARLKRIREERVEYVEQELAEQRRTQEEGQRRLLAEIEREKTLKDAIKQYGDADYDKVLKKKP